MVSPAGATGFWQFLRDTGREYGLEINNEIDERYHVEKSTEAACKYLNDAHDRFGSWTLAAASYNMGMRGLQRQIDRQKSYAYYDLLLNSETARYVFRILAVKELLERVARDLVFDPNDERLAAFYPQALEWGFRRSGDIVYRPHCVGCRACVAVRIAVEAFRPDRSQRRCLERNRAVEGRVLPAVRNAERLALYQRYLSARHPGGGMDGHGAHEFDQFLVGSWANTRFLELREDGRLLAVLRDDLADAGVSLGRDRFFALLLRHDLLIPRPRRGARTTDSRSDSRSRPPRSTRVSSLALALSSAALACSIRACSRSATNGPTSSPRSGRRRARTSRSSCRASTPAPCRSSSITPRPRPGRW